MAGFWLVKTMGPGTGVPGAPAAEVQQLPDGQHPLSLRWGGAVYLGPTVASSTRWISTAAKRLGVPDPRRVPSLGTSFGIIGAEVAGFGAAAAAAGASDIGAAGAAGGGAADAGGAAAGGDAAAGAAGGAGGAAAGKIAGKGLEALVGAAGVYAFGVRALEGLAGAALILLGLQALTGGDGNPVSQVKRAVGTVAKVVR